jgi:hypothetical protein
MSYPSPIFNLLSLTYPPSGPTSGYPKGSLISRSDLSGYWASQVNGNSNNPETLGAGWFPVGAFGGPVTVALSSANVALTALQAAADVIFLTGNLTANLTVTLPSWVGKQWTIINQTTGESIVWVTDGAGTKVRLGPYTEVFCLTTGLLAPNFSGYVNVKAFGAIGDGVTDDTASIQAAINFAAAYANGATVWFPAGKYLISSTLTINKNYVHLKGVNRNGLNNNFNGGSTTPQFIGSGIYTATSGLGDMIYINNGSTGVYGNIIEDMSWAAATGLASPPNGVHVMDASGVRIIRCVAEQGLQDGLKLNGVDIQRVYDYESSNANVTGIHITIQNTLLFTQNDMIWIDQVDLDLNSTAGILIDGQSNDITINDSYIEATPATVLIQPQSGQSLQVYKLTLNNVTSWNNTANPYTNTLLLQALAPSGSANYLHVQGLTFRDCKSYQGNGSSYHISLNQNGNTNGTTGYLGVEIDGGEWDSASTAIAYSDAVTATGDIRGNVYAVNGYHSGSAIALRAGTGTNGWGTEESGTWTPTDGSGASLTFTSASGMWTRKGNVVTASFSITYPSTTNGTGALWSGLPFNTISTPSASMQGGFLTNNGSTQANVTLDMFSNSAGIHPLTTGAANIANSAFSSVTVRGTVIYQSQ